MTVRIGACALALLGGVIVSCSGPVPVAPAPATPSEKPAPPAPWQEMEAMYPQLPQEANAATIYLEACDAALLDAAKYEELPLLLHDAFESRSQPLSQDTRALLKECLDNNTEALRLLHEASGYTECRYPIDFSKAPNIELRHLGPLRLLARLLCWQALYAAESNDPETAARALLDSVSLAQSLRMEPVLLSQLLRSECVQMTTDTLEQVLNRMPLPAQQLEALQSSLAQLDDRTPIVNALVGERFAFTNRNGGPRPGATGLLATQNQLIEAAKKPFPEFVAVGMSVQGCSLGRSVVAFARQMARVSLARTALAIERFRLENKKLPPSLNELIPLFLKELPVDPFDGKPLRYLEKGAGYTVYSVADDLKDDGGERRDERPPRDIVFAVERTG